MLLEAADTLSTSEIGFSVTPEEQGQMSHPSLNVPALVLQKSFENHSLLGNEKFASSTQRCWLQNYNKLHFAFQMIFLFVKLNDGAFHI